MRNTAIHNNHGFSLLELCIAVFLVFFFMGVISAVKGRVIAAQGAHTITEMQSILDGARQFFLSNNRWPNNVIELRTVLPNIPTNNLFGNVYSITPNGTIFVVTTVVPYKSVNITKDGRFAVISDTGSANLIQFTTTIPMDNRIGRLQYEQTWVH